VWNTACICFYIARWNTHTHTHTEEEQINSGSSCVSRLRNISTSLSLSLSIFNFTFCFCHPSHPLCFPSSFLVCPVKFFLCDPPRIGRISRPLTCNETQGRNGWSYYSQGWHVCVLLSADRCKCTELFHTTTNFVMGFRALQLLVRTTWNQGYSFLSRGDIRLYVKYSCLKVYDQ